VIANGENAANGAGITPKIALKLLHSGVDVLTTDIHVWRQKVYSFLATDERIVRPANYPAGSSGRGVTVARPPTAAKSRRGVGHAPCRIDSSRESPNMAENRGT
jgi:calcineurin-like phosphoesterase